MADIRIKDLATTASSTASDDFLAVDGSANGTRKLNAFSPTFGGNVVATGTLTVNSTTDSSSKDTGAIVTEGGLGVEKSATIGGNLTVSGTGTGDTIPYNILAGGNKRIYIGYNTTGDYGALNVADTGVAWKNLVLNQNGGNVLIGQTSDSGQKLQVNGTALISGNLTVSGTGTSSVAGTLLVATTTNSSNGAVQLATHTTSAGGIGFGTDTPLYRSSQGVLNIEANYNGSTWLRMKNTDTGAGAAAGVLFANQLGDYGAISILSSGATPANALLIRTLSTNSLILRTNGNDALTLDSSQKATFASVVSGNSAQFVGAIPPDSGAGIEALYNSSIGTIQTYDRTNSVYKSTAVSGTTVLLQSSGATIATVSSTALSLTSGKALQLGNAYQSGAPTATGYVTIQDSSGTTYKVLVGT